MYNKWYLNALKVTFLFNLILLDTFEMADKETAVVILLSISFATFLGIVLYRIALRI